MIYAVKTLKSAVIYVMLFNAVYNFAETFQNHLKTVLQCLNGDFNTGYKICVICVWGALLITWVRNISVEPIYERGSVEK